MTKNASQNSIAPIHGPQVSHPEVLRGSGGRLRGSAWPWPLNRGFLVCGARGCPHLGGSPGGGCHPELQGREHSWLEGRWEQAASCGNRNCQVLPSVPRGPRQLDPVLQPCPAELPLLQANARGPDCASHPSPRQLGLRSPPAPHPQPRKGPAAPRLCHPLGLPVQPEPPWRRISKSLGKSRMRNT